MRVRPLNLVFLIGILLIIVAGIAALAIPGWNALALLCFGLALALLGGFRYW